MKYPLHDFESTWFENLVIAHCKHLLGAGVIPFAAGRDGGRDGFFHGTSQNFPSSTTTINGKFVIQAKFTSNPIASCSDTSFERLVEEEIPKVKWLKDNDGVEYYMLFTNRKLTGGAELDLRNKIISGTGIKQCWILGIEFINEFLSTNNEVRNKFGLNFHAPLRISPEDLVLVINEFDLHKANVFENATVVKADFNYTVLERKNTINGLTKEYFDHIKEESEQHFDDIMTFLKNPRNLNFLTKYQDLSSELKGQLIAKRSNFPTFDMVLENVYEAFINNEKLNQNKRKLRVFIHFMYCNCDIGQK